MKLKIIIGGIIIIGAIIFGALSFVESNVEYMDFSKAMTIKKKVQVKGTWIKERESSFDAAKGQFTFYMKDDSGLEQRVVFSGAKPNNFEIADAIVIKGRYEDNTFHASEILTKCPSKYQSQSGAAKPAM
jgi:cytochrome c-type biogenesis protein CcmE